MSIPGQPSLLDAAADTPADWPATRRLARALRKVADWHAARAEAMRDGAPLHPGYPQLAGRWPETAEGIAHELRRLASELHREVA